MEEAVWRIDGARAKVRRPHEVPLSRQALAVLGEVKEVSRGSTLVFPSIRSNARPLSENAMNAALRRMGFTQDEMTANRTVLQSDAATSAEVDTVAEGEFQPQSATRVDPDAEVSLAAFEDGVKLRIAFEAFRHIAHRRPRGPVAGHVACLVLVLAVVAEFPPAFHEAVGAAPRIGAQLGFEL